MEHFFMGVLVGLAGGKVTLSDIQSSRPFKEVEPDQKTADYIARAILVSSEVITELLNAKKMHPEHYANQHEAYAVILEEIDELWEEIKKKQSAYDLPAQRKEAIQAAAMLVRFVIELT